MRTGQRGPRVWGLALTAAIHGLLWLLFMHGIEQPRPPSPDPGGVLTVAMVSPPSPSPTQAGEAPLAAEPEQSPEQAAAAVREELHYYFPEELERQLIVLRDRSGEAEIDLPAEVVMHLFIDVQGRVVAITFDGEELAPALQEQLRKAFMTMEFLPGMKQGKLVPSRIKIGIAPLLEAPAPAGNQVD